jgi:hypothetical protein
MKEGGVGRFGVLLRLPLSPWLHPPSRHSCFSCSEGPWGYSPTCDDERTVLSFCSPSA